MKKLENHDPMFQYVEKERTRTLLLEATQDGASVTTYFRRMLLLFLVAVAGGAYFFTTKTTLGQRFVNELAGSPRAAKRTTVQAPEAPRVAQSASVGVDGGKGEADDTEEFLKAQKSREALGQQLEAFSVGKAPAPSPEAIKEAMTGETRLPSAAPPAPTPQ